MINWSWVLKWLEGLSYIATIGGVIAIWITVKSYSTTVKQLKNDRDREIELDNRERVRQSITVLKAFAETIIPDMARVTNSHADVEKQVRQKLLDRINAGLPKEKRQQSLTNDDKTEWIIRITAETESGAGDIFNKLEQISVYVNYGVVDSDLVYDPIHKVFIDFYETHDEFLKFLRSDEAPYKNVTKLYHVWKNQQLESAHSKK